MNLRSLKQSDLDKVRRIHEQFHRDDFPLPGRGNLLSEGLVENGTGIIAYGNTKLLAEIILIMDLSKTPREKCEALKMLLERGIEEARSAHLEQLVCTLSNVPPGYDELLKKHFKFEDVIGRSFVLNL